MKELVEALAKDFGLNESVLGEFMFGVVSVIESEGMAEHFKEADVENQVLIMKMCAAKYLAKQAAMAKHLMMNEEANKAFKLKVLSMLVEEGANIH